MPASKILNNFGERIKKLREQKGMTQQELADKARLHNTYVGSVERGEKNISLKNIEKVVKGLGTSLSEFFSSL